MKPPKWSHEQEMILRSLYESPSLTFEEIAGRLPGRTPMAIRLKAIKLGLHRPFLPEFCPLCGQPLPTNGDQAATEARP